MNRRLAPVAIATLSLLFLSTVSLASAATNLTVSLAPVVPQYAAGADATFIVELAGDGASSTELDFAVEGATLSGVVAPNDTGPGNAQGAAYVRRDTPGPATLVVSLDGAELARSSVEFVPGAPLAIGVQLEAESSAAARTWAFDILNSDGIGVAWTQVGVSGDQPVASVATQPLPFGHYTVRPAASRDAAANCAGTAFYTVSPADGIGVEHLAGLGGSVQFTVRPCTALAGDQSSAATGDSSESVAGVRGAPLPPATGNGQVEKPKLPDYQARQLVGLLLLLGLAFPLGTVLVRLLAHVAPVKKQKK
ncbi:MAG TPA: hypothetical protein VFY90_02695 [Tepidiformaceae bacterium]|nr:hypothetical protein [Tepidiformaceae bacterium]